MGLLADVGLTLGILTAGTVAAVAWRNRPEPGATATVAFMATLVVWEGFHLLAHHSPGGLSALFERLMWLGLGPMPIGMLAFVLASTGRGHLLTRRTVGALAVWPVALNLSLWLPGALAAVGVDVLPRVWPAVAAESGPVYTAHLVGAYGILLLSTGYLVRYVRRERSLFRTQGIAVLAGLGFVYAATAISVFEVFGDLHVHAIPLGLAGMGGAILWATTRGGLTDLVPVATETVLAQLPDAVLVVDADERIVKANPAAREAFDLPADGGVGDPVETHLAGVPEVLAAIRARPDEPTRVEIDERVYDVRATAVGPDRPRDRGVAVIGRDVTAAARRLEAVERKNERLDSFAGFVSHDLRNPLTVAEGNLELARAEVDSEYLDRVAGAHERMKALIDELLALARAGEDIDDPERVDLDRVARDAWAHVETPEATLEVDVDRAVRADPTQLERLFENLYTNAVEHGGPAVAVRVEPLTDGGFAVVDDGPGFDGADPEALFDPGATTGDGAGLGLAVVDSVADAHGWSVTARDDDAGGARFEFRGLDGAAR